METCNIEGCKNKHHCKGLCEKHYNKKSYQGNLEYFKQYYLDNKERDLKYQKQYSKDNKEKIAKYDQDHKEQTKQYCQDNKERFRQYHQANKEEIAKYNKQWRQTPKGKASKKASDHSRRVLEKDLTTKTILKVYKDNIKKYGILTCYLCEKPIIENDKRLKDSLEHLTPITRKGSNNYDNLGIAHLHCNLEKGTMTLEEWKAA